MKVRPGIFGSDQTRSALMAMYDAGLEQWPVPFETSLVPTRYGKTHVIASGGPQSPPLVMLHPAAVGGFVWASIVETLSHTHRLYALDTIGDVGKSQLDDLERHPKTGEDYSRWLDDVYTALGITTADIVAGSMGGWIAMNRAVTAPDTVRRLALFGPMGLPPWRTMAGVLLPMTWYALRPTDAKLDRLIDRSLGPGEAVNRLFRPWMRLLADCHPRLGNPVYLRDRILRRIETPTLVILGGKDGLVGDPAAAAKRARRNIADCEIEILPNAGHIMSVDDPALVGRRTSRFLEPSHRP